MTDRVEAIGRGLEGPGEPPSTDRALLALLKAAIIAVFVPLLVLTFGSTYLLGPLAFVLLLFTPLGIPVAFVGGLPPALAATSGLLKGVRPIWLGLAGAGLSLGYVALGLLAPDRPVGALGWLLYPAHTAAQALGPEIWTRGRDWWEPSLDLMIGIPLGGFLGGWRMGQLLNRPPRPGRGGR